MENTIQLARSKTAVYPVTCYKSASRLFETAKWYFVLDFESTCSPDRSLLPEIIEFPVVLLDSSTGVIFDRFCRLVRPTENPTLTDFCVNLTGIRQEDVDGAQDLAFVLKEFDHWLKLKKHELGCRFKSRTTSGALFVTWTDWDISDCLWNECRRKKLAVPNDLFIRVDLKAIFQQWLASSDPKVKWHGGLVDALHLVGLSFNGRPHRGIDDAVNTARLLLRLLSNNIHVTT